MFESDWYVQLQDPAARHVEIAFVRFDHPSVPEGDQRHSSGVIVTMETEDVDAVYESARKLGHEVVQALRDEAFGQRHFMTRDPAGLVVDIVKLIPMSGEFATPQHEGVA